MTVEVLPWDFSWEDSGRSNWKIGRMRGQKAVCMYSPQVGVIIGCQSDIFVPMRPCSSFFSVLNQKSLKVKEGYGVDFTTWVVRCQYYIQHLFAEFAEGSNTYLTTKQYK